MHPPIGIRDSKASQLRRFLALAGAFGVLMIGLVATNTYRLSAARHELADAIAETDSLDVGWGFTDLEAQRQLPSGERNAALQVFAVHLLLPAAWPSPSPQPQDKERGSEDNVFDLPPERQLTKQQVTPVRADLDRAGPALAEARKLWHMPEGRYPVNWAADVISTPSPWLDAFLSTRHLLKLDALLCDQEEDPDAGLLCARALLNVGRSLGDEPFLHGPANRNGCRFETARMVERTLAQGQPSEIAMAAMQESIALEEHVPLPLHHFRGERAVMHVFLTRVEQGQNRLSELSCLPARGFDAHVETWFGRLHAIQIHARFLRGINEAVEIAKLPLDRQFPMYREWRRRRGPVENVGDGLRLSGAPEDGLLAGHALLRCTLVAVAAERYRSKHGDWPRAITNLVPDFLSAAPLDPFDGQELRYRRTNTGAVIYSVGPDARDDGGDSNQSLEESGPRDVVFRLWAIDLRRQPAIR